MSVLVGICGGSGSGKTTLADAVAGRLRAERGTEAATVLSFDSYYHDQADVPWTERLAVNYDHPDSLDHELLVEHLRQLQIGNDVAVPVYDFANHTRSSTTRLVPAAEVVIVEGILLFAFDAVTDELDLTVFRRCPEDVRFARRTRRDIADRGRSPESVREQLAATVKPMHDRFVEPYAERANYIADHGNDLDDVVGVVVQHLARSVTMTEF